MRTLARVLISGIVSGVTCCGWTGVAKGQVNAPATQPTTSPVAQEIRYTRLRITGIQPAFSYLRFQEQFHAAEVAGVKHVILLVNASESDPGEAMLMARWLSRASERPDGPMTTAIVNRADVGAFIVALACSRVYMLPEGVVEVSARVDERAYQATIGAGKQFQQRRDQLLAGIREVRAKQRMRDDIRYTSGQVYQMQLIGGSCRTMTELRAALGVQNWIEQAAFDPDADRPAGELVVRERAPEVDEARKVEHERDAATRLRRLRGVQDSPPRDSIGTYTPRRGNEPSYERKWQRRPDYYDPGWRSPTIHGLDPDYRHPIDSE